MTNWLRIARDRADLLALAGIALAAIAVTVPGGIYGVGLVAGAAIGLQVLGLILVYRANRIINFAQVQLGVVAGVLFRLMVEQQTLLRALDAVCDPCVDTPGPLLSAILYWVSLLVCVAAAVAVSFLVCSFVIKRFADAPRLVLAVATVGIAQLLASVQAALPGILATPEQRDLSQVPVGVSATPPLDFQFRWAPAIFRAPDLLMVVALVVATGLLAAYLRSSGGGLGMRAAAENPQRASTLGIDVNRSGARVWMIAGLLSAIAGVVLAMSSPAPPPTSLAVAPLVRILAAGVIASMTSLPLGVLAALALGLFDQAMLWTLGSPATVDGLVTLVIALVLILQRARVSRVAQELSGAWRAAREVRPIPAELRALPSVRRWLRSGAVTLGVLALAYPIVMSPLQTTVMTTTFIYAMVGISLLILSGWAGQISLGQFAIAAVGGYAASLAGANASVPMPFAVIVGAVAGAAVAWIVGLPAIHLRGLQLAVTTLALALTTSALVLSPTALGRWIPDDVQRPALLGIDLDDGRTFYYVTLLVLAALVSATVGLRRSRFGRALIAARDNELAAQSYGIALVRVRLWAFGVSGAVAGIAGAMFVYQQHGLKPASFTPDVSVGMFLMAVIGGLGSVAGPLLGALALGILDLLSASPLVVFLATGGGVVLLLLAAPGGLVQIAHDARDALLRRTARRHRIVVPSLVSDPRVRDRARATLAPKAGTADAAAFVPERYALRDQWAIDRPAEGPAGA